MNHIDIICAKQRWDEKNENWWCLANITSKLRHTRNKTRTRRSASVTKRSLNGLWWIHEHFHVHRHQHIPMFFSASQGYRPVWLFLLWLRCFSCVLEMIAVTVAISNEYRIWSDYKSKSALLTFCDWKFEMTKKIAFLVIFHFERIVVFSLKLLFACFMQDKWKK